MPDKMIRNAGLGDDGTAKAIRTDNAGNIVLSTGDTQIITKPVTIQAGEYLYLDEFPVDHYTEFDFILTLSASNLVSGTDFELSVSFRDGLPYSDSKFGLGFTIGSQMNPVRYGGPLRSITVEGFKRVPTFGNYMSLVFVNNSANDITIVRQMIRRFV